MTSQVPMGLRFSLLHRSFKKMMDEMLREQDLTGVQFGVLGALARLERESGAEVHQKDLERLTRVTHPTMTEILKRLEKKELILCEVSDFDRRHKSIRSAPRAQRLLAEAEAVEAATFRRLCRGLSGEQIEQLIAVTDLMLQNALEGCGKGCDADCD